MVSTCMQGGTFRAAGAREVESHLVYVCTFESGVKPRVVTRLSACGESEGAGVSTCMQGGGGGLPFEERCGERLELEVGVERRHVGDQQQSAAISSNQPHSPRA